MSQPRLAVVTLWAEDVPAAAHFYRDVIGLRLLPHHHNGRPHFDVGGVYLTIVQGKPAPAPTRFPFFAFAVDDLGAAVERLRAQHIELPWGIEEDTGSRWAMFHDPAGNLIEIAQFKADGHP
jgi:catechol 2,3-dioxygenase-like lactoylglutathione lyase family enzyme